MNARAAAAVVSVALLESCAAPRASVAPLATPREAPLPELPTSATAPPQDAPPEAELDSPPLPVRLARHRGESGLAAVSVARAGTVTELRIVVRGAGLAAEASLAKAAASALSARLRAAPPPFGARVSVTAELDALIVSLVSTEPATSARAVAAALREVGATSDERAAHPAGEIALFRALFRLPASVHPYSELAPTSPPPRRDVTRFVEARVVADAITVVAVGALDARSAHDAVASALGATRAGSTPSRPTPPVSPDAPRFFVIDAPSDAPEVTVGLLTLDRADDAWPELVVDARARREHLRATIPELELSLVELRDGPCPVVAAWRSVPTRLVDETRAVLAALPPDAPPPPAPSRDRALRSLARGHAMIAGQPRRLADRLAALAAMGRDEPVAAPSLPPKPRLPQSLGEQPPSAPVVVVEGDAATLAPALASLGDVTVLDPARALAPSRVVKASR